MPYKNLESQRKAQRNYMRRKRLARRKIFFEGKKCERCEFADGRALEYHHKDPNKKEFTIGQIMAMPIDKILKEIEKCELICANCHTIEHRKNMFG